MIYPNYLAGVLVALVLISKGEGCRHFPKDIGYKPEDGHSVSGFFVECMEESAGSIFPSLRTVIDFIIEDSNWYHNVYHKLCPGVGDVEGCWTYALVFLLEQNSALYEPAKKCIADALKKWPLTNNTPSQDTPSFLKISASAKTLSPEDEKAFSDCMGQELSVYNFLGDYLEDADVESLTMFFRIHYTYCTNKDLAENSYDERTQFQAPHLSKRCPSRGRKSTWRKKLINIYEDFAKIDGPLADSFTACKNKLDTNTLVEEVTTLSVMQGSGGCLVIDQPCVSTKNATSVGIYTEEECKTQPECCWYGNECRVKFAGTGTPSTNSEAIFKPPETSTINGAKARFLSFGSPFNPMCGQKSPIDDCEFYEGQPYVLEPPMNIPYCVRIPCSLDPTEQDLYDRDQKSCGIQPGCYFDVELFEYRDAGYQVLPGIPVCHYAIRNSVFQVEARKVMEAMDIDFWNPYYTYCTLQKNDAEIRKEPEGCRMLKVLEVFKVPPKLAGWKGITSYHCMLIDACWVSGYGCFYPAKIDDIVVKTGQRPKRQYGYEIMYGRPKCQHFDNRSPLRILKSYHQCLLAGCSVSTDISSKYFHNFYQLGETMSPPEHWLFWEKVKMGEIGPHNLDEIKWEYRDEMKIPTPPPKTGGPPGFSSLALLAASLGQPPPKLCGPQYKMWGQRPCAPETPPKPPIGHPKCPYKPVSAPRFRPLTGSFFGCCDVNPCYLSKKDIREMHSGPANYYTEWTAFTPCSKTCGKGIQTRNRRCVGTDKSHCTEKTEDIQPCTPGKCGEWGRWSSWSKCRHFCDQQIRSRKCMPKKAFCAGPAQESKRCPCF